MIKKFMVLLLVISFSFTMPVRVHADAINVDEYLREKGMSELAIHEYSYEEKLELYYADDISFEEVIFVQVIDESSQDISSVQPSIFGSLGFSYGGKYGTFSISAYYDTMALSRTVSW